MSQIKAINEETGEVVEFDISTAEDIASAWKHISTQIKMYQELKSKLRNKVLENARDGELETKFGKFIVSDVQRYNYDKYMMSKILDEDTMDLFLIPDKKKLDDWLKENPEIKDDLQETMIPVGKPYKQVRLI